MSFKSVNQLLKQWNVDRSRKNYEKYCKYIVSDAVSLIEVKQVWYH